MEEANYAEDVLREAEPDMSGMAMAAQMDDDKMFMDESAFERTAS